MRDEEKTLLRVMFCTLDEQSAGSLAVSLLPNEPEQSLVCDRVVEHDDSRETPPPMAAHRSIQCPRREAKKQTLITQSKHAWDRDWSMA